MSRQPNILLIVTDQHAAEALSCAGNRDLRTPHLDALAARGVRFTRALCSNPLCSPSRKSIWTGVMPSQLPGKDEESMPEPWRPRSLGRWLSVAGYECHYGGKWHAGGPIELPDPAQEDYGFRCLAGFDDHALTAACETFLQNPPAGAPWFLAANFDNPHNICEYGRHQECPWGEPPPPAGPGALPTLPANFEPSSDEPFAVTTYRRHGVKVQMDSGYTETDWRRYRHGYNRLVEQVDAQIGRILAALAASPAAANTVVVFTSDHGELAGAHRLSHKQQLFDEAVRVPLIVADPRTPSVHGSVRDDLCNIGLDLFPTFCDYAGAAAPADLAGLSLRPAAEDRAGRARHESVLVETTYGGPYANTAARLVRSARFSYHLHDWGPRREQLFDLAADPGETRNLAADPAHRAELERHRDLFIAWCRRTGSRFAEHYAHFGHVPVPGRGFVAMED